MTSQDVLQERSSGPEPAAGDDLVPAIRTSSPGTRLAEFFEMKDSGGARRLLGHANHQHHAALHAPGRRRAGRREGSGRVGAVTIRHCAIERREAVHFNQRGG